MERTTQIIYVQILIGILFFTASLSPTVHLTLAQRVDSVIPSNIRAFELIELDGAPLRAEVEAGRTVTLSFGTRQFELRLVPNNLLSAEYAAHLDPALRDTGTFRGTVVGDPDSIVRLSLRAGLVRGYILTGTGDWYFIEPIRHYGDPAELNVPWNLHFIYKTTDVELQLDLSNDVVQPELPSLFEELESAKSTPTRAWVEHRRTQTSILYYDAANPLVKQGEFGHTFTWDATTDTWAPYAVTQGPSGEYQVNVSSGSYVVSHQGVQLVDPTSGALLVQAANWQVIQWNSQTGTWTPLEFPYVTVTEERTADSLWVIRTLTGDADTGQLTETYQFGEVMKVTARYTAAVAGTYQVEWDLQGLPLHQAPGDGPLVEGAPSQLQFDQVRIAWEDAAEQVETARVSSTPEEKSLTLNFRAVSLVEGDVLEIDPTFGFKPWGGNGDGWINKVTSTWTYTNQKLHVANQKNGESGNRETFVSFDLQGYLDHASEILLERVKLYEQNKGGEFIEGDEVIKMGYFQDNVKMGAGGDPPLNSWQNISNSSYLESGLEVGHSDINGNWLDLDTVEQWVYWVVPQNELGNWTQPGDQYANYYFKGENFEANSDFLKFRAREYSEGSKLPKLNLHWKEQEIVLDMHFESLTNNVVVDSSEYGHNGTNHGASLTAEGEGLIGKALDFEGPGEKDYVDLGAPYALRLDNENWTLAAWVNLESHPTNGSTIFFEAGAAQGRDDYQMINLVIKPTIADPDIGEVKLSFYGDAHQSSIATVPRNQWTHVAVTYDCETLVGKYYINGSHKDSHTFAHGPDFSDWSGALIGRAWWPAWDNNYLNGTLDELHVYTRVLSGPEIANMFSRELDPVTYTGYVRDYSGTALNYAKVECIDTGDYDWTNAAGYYSFITREGIGEYTLKALKPYYGYVPVEHDVSAAAGTHQVNFTLPWLAKVYLGVDPAFTAIFDDDPLLWMAEQRDIMNLVEGIFYDQLLVNFTIVDQVKCTDCTQTNASHLLSNFTSFIDNNATRDFGHLFSGSNLDGTTVGLSYVLLHPSDGSILRYPKIANSLIQYVYFSDVGRSIISAHEIGHTFNGTHEEAATWQEWGQSWYTILWEEFKGDDYMVAEFSDGTQQSGRDNKTWLLKAASKWLPD